MQTTARQRDASRVVHRVGGHFGEWLQGRLGPRGPVVLVTLACDVLFAEASLEPADHLELRQSMPSSVTSSQLRTLLRGIGKPESGIFRLFCTAPPGAGAGASTASLVALARTAGGSEELLSAACLAAEGASDPLMLPGCDTILWSSRLAEVQERFPAPPSCEIVGGFLGDPVRTDATDHDFADISDLVPLWRKAAEVRDLPRLATLASEAADRTTRLRGPVADPMPEIARDLGALGYARAHTGSARALIFAPGTAPAHSETVLECAGLHGTLRFLTGRKS